MTPHRRSPMLHSASRGGVRRARDICTYPLFCVLVSDEGKPNPESPAAQRHQERPRPAGDHQAQRRSRPEREPCKPSGPWHRPGKKPAFESCEAGHRASHPIRGRHFKMTPTHRATSLPANGIPPKARRPRLPVRAISAIPTILLLFAAARSLYVPTESFEWLSASPTRSRFFCIRSGGGSVGLRTPATVLTSDIGESLSAPRTGSMTRHHRAGRCRGSGSSTAMLRKPATSRT